MHTGIELLGIVGQNAFTKGRAYAREGRARVTSHNEREETVVGTCRGSGNRTYNVQVTYEMSAHGIFRDLEGLCSCPVGYNCKHTVALMLQAQAAQAAQASAQANGLLSEGTAPQASPTGRGRDFHRPLPRQPQWQDVLAEAFPPAERDTTPLALAFEVKQGVRSGGYRDYRRPWVGAGAITSIVQVRPMRPGKRTAWINSGATWGDIRARRVHHAASSQVEALDALCRLHDATDPYSYGNPTWISLAELDSPTLWPVLERIVATGVTLLGLGDHRHVILEDEPGSATIAIRQDSSGVQDGSGVQDTPADDEASTQPSLHIRAEAHHRLVPAEADLVLLGAPPHGLLWTDEAGLHLAPLEAIATPSWVSLSYESAGVRIPGTDRVEFVRTVLPRILREPWSSPDDSFTPPDPPTPTLHLDLQVSTTESDPRAQLAWFFQYEDPTGYGYGPLDLTPHPGDPARDETREADLTSAVARALAALPATLDDDAPRPRSQLRGLDVVALVHEVLPVLEELGVALTTSDLPSFTDAGRPQVQVSVAEAGRDWFDLEVTMSVAGHQVPIGLVITALAQEKEALFLPDGSYVLLDDQQLQQLRELLAEGRALTDGRRKELRVGRVQMSWWEELLSLGVVQTAEHAWFEAVRRSAESPPAPAPLPQGVRADLRPYQLTGFEWLSGLRRARLGGILADDMGLGKTLQVLAMISDERTDAGGSGPTAAGSPGPGQTSETGDGGTSPDAAHRPWLVVAPTSVVGNWAAEAARFTPDLKVAVVAATQARRKETLAELADGADVLVTSYALLRLEVEQYTDLGVAGLVLDEAQHAKNHTSKAFASAKKVGAPVTFAVTGTPLENSLAELWAMTALVAPGLLGSPAQFREVYQRPIERRDPSANRLLTRLRRRVTPFLLRRTKDQVATDLPPKQEQILPVELAPAHRRIYDRHLQRERQRVLRLVDDLDQNRVEVLSALTRLRQLAIDSSLVEPETTAPGSKLEALLPLLREAAAEGHRVLVFSQFTRYLRMIGERLTEEGLGYSYLDGATRRRDEVIRGFAEGDDAVFLISLKAGGVGLNLTMADYAVLADPWWNPAVEAQAVDRAHRIGQQRPVMVYRLVATNTIEEKVLALQAAKRELVAGILQAEGDVDGDARVARDAAGVADVAQTRGGSGSGALTAEDLRELLA